MKLSICVFAACFFLFTACKKEDDLPTPDAVMVKFVNQTGSDIEELTVSRVAVGDLGKGKTSAEYHRYEQLGQQFGYVLVEAVGTINGKKHFTGAACQGICGTASAPNGTWLEPDYYKIAVQIAKDEPNAMEFKLLE
jgi:hypothetical protein